MRIGLNLLHLHEGIGGVWNYVENLMEALGRLEREHTYIVFVTSCSLCLVPGQKNFIPVVIPISPLNTKVRILFENTVLHYLAKKFCIDCIHWFANVVSPISFVPCLVTIHDLLPLRDTRAYSVSKQRYLRCMLWITGRRATSILAISRTTAADVQTLLKPKTDQIHIVPVVLDKKFRPSPGDGVAVFREKYGLPDRFWLYVANCYPHKNHLGLIQAYADLKQKNLQPWPLVLRGDAGPDTGNTFQNIQAKIEKLGLSRDVIWLQRLDYAELPLLYASAAALVFPSLFEGGGIPVVEAMACGCPVAASDIAVVKEFAKDAALFFDGTSISAMVDAMAELQKNASLQQRLKGKGFFRAGRFSGDLAVKKLMAAYEQISSIKNK